MIKLNRKQLIEFNNTLELFVSENTNNLNKEGVKTILQRLTVIETKLNKYYEIDCNYGLSDRQNSNCKKYENEAVQLVNSLGFKCELNGDPRGASICVFLPSKRFNSWDGETWRLSYVYL